MHIPWRKFKSTRSVTLKIFTLLISVVYLNQEKGRLKSSCYCICVMGKCVVCEKETPRVLFKDAIAEIYICSEKCLRKYFEPTGGVKIMKKLKENEGWLD